jgi:hypothetical protein
MIHADVAIARLRQLLDCEREQTELRFVVGKVGVVDLSGRLASTVSSVREKPPIVCLGRP